ncbi:hypothetical protein Tco_0699729 [Tanacetum coccineum]
MANTQSLNTAYWPSWIRRIGSCFLRGLSRSAGTDTPYLPWWIWRIGYQNSNLQLSSFKLQNANMNPIATQQVALNNALVALEKRLNIEKCNARIEFVPDSPTKILLNLHPKMKWFYLSRNLVTLASVICYLRSILIKYTSPGEHLLLSSIGESLERQQDLIGLENQELKSCGDKTISMRNKINLHTVRDDTLLGTLKFVSKTQDYQRYGALIPEEMINQDIKDSKAYRTYLYLATRKLTPKKSRKFKKVASPSKKLSPILEKEPAEKPKRAKKPAKKSTTVPIAGVVIRDTPGVSVSKKKAPTKADRGKGMDLLSEAALLEAA